MLTISTMPEALAELERATGRVWSDSELFDVAVHRGIKLHAAAPITARITVQKWVDQKGMVDIYRSAQGRVSLAKLSPANVQQLWVCGETVTNLPSDPNQLDEEVWLFTEPVRVTRDQIRIKAHWLKKIAEAWHQAQAGRWIKDAKQPTGMRWQRPPDWLFPAESHTPQTSTPATALAGRDQIPDPQRRLARLRAELNCEPRYKNGTWSFPGSTRLANLEAREGRQRSSEKVVRADLKEAAGTERDAKLAQPFDGLAGRT